MLAIFVCVRIYKCYDCKSFIHTIYILITLMSILNVSLKIMQRLNLFALPLLYVYHICVVSFIKFADHTQYTGSNICMYLLNIPQQKQTKKHNWYY